MDEFAALFATAFAPRKPVVNNSEEALLNITVELRMMSRALCKSANRTKKEYLKKNCTFKKGDASLGSLDTSEREFARANLSIMAKDILRMRTEETRVRNMAARIDGLVSRLGGITLTQTSTMAMQKCAEIMTSSLAESDLGTISVYMDQFERSMEDMDVADAAVNATLTATAKEDANRSAVEQLVADTHADVLADQLPSVPSAAALAEAQEVAQLIAEVAKEVQQSRVASQTGAM